MSDKRTDGWYDEEAGRLVPSYYLAGGRTNSSRAHLDISTQVKAAHGYTTRTGLSPEQIAILSCASHCWWSRSFSATLSSAATSSLGSRCTSPINRIGLCCSRFSRV
jgi:hypothetical protein